MNSVAYVACPPRPQSPRPSAAVIHSHKAHISMTTPPRTEHILSTLKRSVRSVNAVLSRMAYLTAPESSDAPSASVLIDLHPRDATCTRASARPRFGIPRDFLRYRLCSCQADLGGGSYTPESDDVRLIAGEVRPRFAFFVPLLPRTHPRTAQEDIRTYTHARAAQEGQMSAYQRARLDEQQQLEAFFAEVREIQVCARECVRSCVCMCARARMLNVAVLSEECE
jgi:hypothetical protein